MTHLGDLFTILFAFGTLGCAACALLGYVADKLGDILTTEDEDV